MPSIAERLRDRAKFHRDNGWETMRESDPDLLEKAADALDAADAREDKAYLNGAKEGWNRALTNEHDAFEKAFHPRTV